MIKTSDEIRPGDVFWHPRGEFYMVLEYTREDLSGPWADGIPDVLGTAHVQYETGEINETLYFTSNRVYTFPQLIFLEAESANVCK